MTDEVEKVRIAMFGFSKLTAEEEYSIRTAASEHAPDCNCTICKSDEGYERR